MNFRNKKFGGWDFTIYGNYSFEFALVDLEITAHEPSINQTVFRRVSECILSIIKMIVSLVPLTLKPNIVDH